MNIYCVGGAVRDALLNRPVQDHDWVVVGCTPEEMLERGFKPVGKAFPVFLHPASHEEYALARTEKKIGPGHTGFSCYASPDVTLEEDLQRRDLTINAMAFDQDGTLIDPYGGKADLEAGILRHVSPAFRDDPLRVLRVARFAARFGFRVADETQHLLKEMVDSGELDHLSPERVWAEWSQGLASTYPAAMVSVLHECGALASIWPALHHLWQQEGVFTHPNMPPIPNAGVWLLDKLNTLSSRAFAPIPTLVPHTDNEAAPSQLLMSLTLCTIALYAAYAAHASDTGAKTAPQHDTRTLRQHCMDHAIKARWPKSIIGFQQHILHVIDILEIETLENTAVVRLFEKLDVVRRPSQAQEVLTSLKPVLSALPEWTIWLNRLHHLEHLMPLLKTITPQAWLNTVEPSQIPQRLFEERLEAVRRYFNLHATLAHQ